MAPVSGSQIERTLGKIFAAAAEGSLRWDDATQKRVRGLVNGYSKLDEKSPEALQLQEAVFKTIDALPVAERCEAAFWVFAHAQKGSDLKTRALEKIFTAIDGLPATERDEAAQRFFALGQIDNNLRARAQAFLEKLEKERKKERKMAPQPSPMSVEEFLKKMAALPGAGGGQGQGAPGVSPP